MPRPVDEDEEESLFGAAYEHDLQGQHRRQRRQCSTMPQKDLDLARAERLEGRLRRLSTVFASGTSPRKFCASPGMTGPPGRRRLRLADACGVRPARA